MTGGERERLIGEIKDCLEEAGELVRLSLVEPASDATYSADGNDGVGSVGCGLE